MISIQDALQLICINSLKTPVDIKNNKFHTQKEIGLIPEEDLIEVFI